MQNLENLVSIILPVHNNARHLAECLQSLLSQSYENIEIIAIDDNSKDNSFAILKQFRKQDKRLKISKNKKRYGLAICFNRAIKRSKGKFIAFSGQRDIHLKPRIQKQLLFLLSHPKVVALGTQCTFIGRANKRLGKSSFPLDNTLIQKALISGSSLQFETTMVNRSLLPKDILYFTNKTYPHIFSDVFMKLTTYGEFANLPNSLYYHRKPLIPTQNTKYLFSYLKLWIKYVMLYDARPSIRSLFFPLVKQA